jgi:two-component sensor histidine kinase
MQETDPKAERPLDLELDPLPASVGAARREAGAVAERVGADRSAVELAVSEAVGNAVLHAFPEGTSGTVWLSVETTPQTIVLTVSDDGVGMRPNPFGRGLGFGLPLIAQLAEEVEIMAREGGGTVLRMRFQAAATA